MTAAEWKPIESAPKDGSDILLFATAIPSGKPFIVVGFMGPSGWSTRLSNREGNDILIKPTHWMALPLPPT